MIGVAMTEYGMNEFGMRGTIEIIGVQGVTALDLQLGRQEETEAHQKGVVIQLDGRMKITASIVKIEKLGALIRGRRKKKRVKVHARKIEVLQ